MNEFLTSAPDVGEHSASHPGRFTPGGWAPRIYWIGAGWDLKLVTWMIWKTPIFLASVRDQNSIP